MELTTRIILWSFQIAAFVVAVISYNKTKHTTQQHFVYYLGFVMLVELFGYLIPQLFHVKSQFVYNIYVIVSFLFYLLWFRRILKHNKAIPFFIIVFAISVFLAIIYEDFWQSLWKIPLITGTILLLISSVLYYKELLQSNAILDYKKSQTFWIVTGLLIFHIGFLPLLLAQPYIKVSRLPYRMAIMILNILLYGFIIKSYLCLKTK